MITCLKYLLESEMTVHKKILLLLLISVSIYTVLGIAFQQFLILPSFQALEQEEARKDVRRCVEALHREVHHLDLFCFDWAAWDDTYRYIADPTEAYESSNLSAASFIDNDINLIYLFDRSGALVWGQYYDLDLEEPVPFPDFPAEGLAATHQILNHKTRDNYIHGIYRSSKGALLLASRPILPSEAEDNEVIRGTFVMGRLLGPTILEEIQQQTQVDLDLYPIEDDRIPESVRLLPVETEEIHYTSAELLQAYANVPDITGKPTLTFVTYLPRSIMARGHEAIRLQTMAAGAAGLAFVLLLAFFMRGLVSHPLHVLSEQAKRVRLGNTPEPVAALRRNDEIGRLARDFHSMLRRLRREEEERSRAQLALRNSQARLETILKTAPDAIVITNADGVVESANDAAGQLFGHPTEQLTGMRGRDLLADEEQHYWVKAVATYAGAPGPEPFTADRESAIRRADGTELPVHMCVTSMYLDGELYFTSSVRDISEIRAIQARMARAQHLASIGEMGATVAHEIRNPLAGMRGAIHLLQSGDLPDSLRTEALQGVSESVDRIAHTVDQLLGYARPLTPRRSSFRLRPLLEAVSELSPGETPPAHDVTITCPESLSLIADPNLIRRVLENLWLNAQQSAGPAGSYQWTAEAAHGSITIELTDNGSGLEEATALRLFEPFFTTRVEGTGLGLAVSLRILEAHHGSIHLENRPPGGVAATISLPEGVA